MYAVIKTGGKQYRVCEGQVLRIEKLDVNEGDPVNIDNVLIVGIGSDIKIGNPTVKGANVSATVKAHVKGKKIKIIKFRRRKNRSRTKQGHRQNYTEIEIVKISVK